MTQTEITEFKKVEILEALQILYKKVVGLNSTQLQTFLRKPGNKYINNFVWQALNHNITKNLKQMLRNLYKNPSYLSHD